MGGFVGDEFGTCQFFIQGRMFAEKHAGVVVQRSSRMLHPSVLEARQNDETVLFKRIRDIGIVLQPMQRRSDLSEDIIQLCHLLRVRFPVIGREDAFSVGIIHFLQLPCYEREQVRAKWFGGKESDVFPSVGFFFGCNGCIGYGFPFGRHLQLESKRRLQVRLFEAGEDGSGTVGYQQRIQELIVTVERLVACRKADVYLVFPCLGRGLRQNDMLVQETIVNRFPIDGYLCYLVCAFTEIEDDFLRLAKEETSFHLSFHVLLFLFRNGEEEVVFQFLDFLLSELG